MSAPFEFSEVQAEYILDMQLSQLTRLGRARLEEELAKLRETIAELQATHAAEIGALRQARDAEAALKDMSLARLRLARTEGVGPSGYQRLIPSPMETPASPAATPIEKGLTVDPMTPVIAPTMIIAAVTIRSYPSAAIKGMNRA